LLALETRGFCHMGGASASARQASTALFTRKAMPYAARGRTGMNDQASKRAQKLRQALRENLKRRKAEGASGSAQSAVRREDRLEPRLGNDRPGGADVPKGDVPDGN
jgi:cysteine sulfinate desulfinase/cysteine desulfurase-like protein